MTQNHTNGDPTDDRLAALKSALSTKTERADAPTGHATATVFADAFKLGATLVVTVAVGGALGYGLGRVFGAMPLFLLAGLGFGFAAAIRDTVRLAKVMENRAKSGVDRANDDGAAP